MSEYFWGSQWSLPPFNVAAAAIGTLVVAWVARREASLWRILAAGAVVGVFALAGARLYHLVQVGMGPDVSLRALFQGAGGYRLPGALLGAAVGTGVAMKSLLREHPVGRVADYVALGMTAAIPVIRTGCLCFGCCFGTVTRVPWAIRFPAQSPPWRHHVARGLSPFASYSLPVHPLQIYFALLALALVPLLLALLKRNRDHGLACILFLLIHESGKAYLETLRDPTAPGESALRLVSLGIAAGALLALVAFLMLRRSHPRLIPADGVAR